MRLCISHIAWPVEREAFYLEEVAKLGCNGLEVAPSRLWAEPVDAKVKERREYRRMVESFGLRIISLHALLFTRPELGFFKSSAMDWQTVEYLKQLCFLAADLGAKILVFGSPANRMRGGLSRERAMSRAVELLKEVADSAVQSGTCMCVEPLGREETDFINSALEGLELVDMVGSPGFGLHLDSKAMSEEAQGFAPVLQKVLPYARHFHVSEPELAVIGSSGRVDHAAMGRILRESVYRGYVSVEMRTQINYDIAIRESIKVTVQNYFKR